MDLRASDNPARLRLGRADSAISDVFPAADIALSSGWL
jgi:hypothetical protein